MTIKDNVRQLQGRYELRDVLGRGGMGVVYRAFDLVMNREVAVKTLLDVKSPELRTQFFKEWSILAAMVHPNIVSIYDIGEFDSGGAKVPFFVMPLLPGASLDRLIKEGSPRLTVKAVLDIVDQTSRGLQAAHELGLVHRDVKPSNIFVMDDDSVKVIDFGIARQASASSHTSLKGTLFYLAPEQLEMKPPSPLWDQFSLGVVTYEAFTRRRPFTGATDDEVAQNIRKYSPPPASELNHEVPFAVSQVIHKAIAKQPWHRFLSVKEFGGALQKAIRNEPLDYFNRDKIKSRLDRAAQSFESGDVAFASDVVAELEGEGHLDQEVALLRGRLDQAVRQSRIQQLLESARRFFEASEYSLALRKIQEVLDINSGDANALALRNQIERARQGKKIEDWLGLAHQHIKNQAFTQAKEAIDNILQLKPNDTEALSLVAEVRRLEEDAAQIREEKAGLYQSAVEAWERGEITNALSRLDLLMRLDRDHPDSTRSSGYQNLYNKVQSERDDLKNAYDEARRNLAADNFSAALAICKQYLSKYPTHALFQSLKFDIEQRQQQTLSATIAETDRRVEAEPDLDRRVGILEQALKTYPSEPHFETGLRLAREKRDLVESIVAKARFLEEHGKFVEALDQWQILRSIHDRQPGIAFEIERLIQRRDQQARETAKARWVELADKHLESGDSARAQNAVANGLAEFPGEAELLELEKLVQKSLGRERQAQDLLRSARVKADEDSLESCATILREAHQIDPRNSVIRTVLINSLVKRAQDALEKDFEFAEKLVQEIFNLDPQHPAARSLATRIADRRRDEFVAWCLSQARRLQAEGDLGGASAVVSQGLATYPKESRLLQLHATLDRAQAPLSDPPVAPPVRYEPPVTVTPVSSEPPNVHKPAPRTAVYVSAAVLVIVLTLAAFAIYKLRGRTAVVREPAPDVAKAIPSPEPVAPPAEVAPLPATPMQVRLGMAEGVLSIDGEAAKQLDRGAPQTLPLSAGEHSIAFVSGASRVSFTVATGASQMPELKGGIDANLARALVLTRAGTHARLQTNKDGVRAFIDGRPTGTVKNGVLEIPDLERGSHTLRLTGPLAGEVQQIVLDDDAEYSILFSLSGDKNQGLVTVVASEPDATILVNGKPAHPLVANGRAFLYLPPRKYTIGVEKQGFDSPPPQSANVLADQEAKLEFVLTAKKAPAPVKEPPKVAATPTPSPTPAPPPQPVGSITPPKIVAPPPTPAPTLGFTLADWLTAGWVRSEGYVVHEGGNYVLAPFESKGVIVFTVTLLHGKRIEWVVNFLDEKNCHLFSIDDEQFQHIDIFGGKKTKTKVSYAFDHKVPIRIAVAITPTDIVHRIFLKQQWAGIEDWKSPAGRPSGKFGFVIPNHDKLGLSEFQFQPAK
jgi:serine/threonine protein kinase